MNWICLLLCLHLSIGIFSIHRVRCRDFSLGNSLSAFSSSLKYVFSQIVLWCIMWVDISIAPILWIKERVIISVLLSPRDYILFKICCLRLCSLHCCRWAISSFLKQILLPHSWGLLNLSQLILNVIKHLFLRIKFKLVSFFLF